MEVGLQPSLEVRHPLTNIVAARRFVHEGKPACGSEERIQLHLLRRHGYVDVNRVRDRALELGDSGNLKNGIERVIEEKVRVFHEVDAADAPLLRLTDRAAPRRERSARRLTFFLARDHRQVHRPDLGEHLHTEEALGLA